MESAFGATGFKVSKFKELGKEIRDIIDEEGENFKHFGKMKLKEFESQAEMDSYI